MCQQPSTLFFGRPDCNYSLALRDHLNSLDFSVQEVWSRQRGEDLPGLVQEWHGDYIFCFRSYFILPLWLITRAKHAAVNLHPGPPEYRGSGCLNWALYDEVSEYGVTAHFMSENVDEGPIIDVKRFSVHQTDSVSSLLDRTHECALQLACELINGVADGGVSYLHMRELAAKEEWSGPIRRMASVDSLSQVDPATSRKELERVIRATHTPEFPTYVDLFGYRFRLESTPGPESHGDQ